MKKSALFGMAALGMAAVGLPQAFATPVLTVTTGSGTYTHALTDVSAYLGSGTYGIGSQTLDGFTWGGVIAHVGATQFTVDVSSVSNSNSGNSNGMISFAVTQDGFSGTGIASLQATGGTTATNASDHQTVDFNGSAYAPTTPNPTLLGQQDSGVIGMNSVVPASPSSSVAFSPLTGVNLSGSSSTLNLTDTLTLEMNPATYLNAGSLTTNLSDSSVPTPEPATLAIFAVGGLALLAGARRRKNKA